MDWSGFWFASAKLAHDQDMSGLVYERQRLRDTPPAIRTHWQKALFRATTLPHNATGDELGAWLLIAGTSHSGTVRITT